MTEAGSGSRPQARGAQSYVDWLWDKHLLAQDAAEDLLYVDLHMVHDLSALAFSGLEASDRKVRRPDRTVAFADHTVPTDGSQSSTCGYASHAARELVDQLLLHTANAGIQFHPPGTEGHGIAHVAAAELGIVRPGMSVVCGDSHTCTLGALGALAFGIGLTDVEHVLATQTIWAKRPKVLNVVVNGILKAGVTAKDVALTLVARLSGGAGAGKALEFSGDYIASASMDERFTICNLAAETGARIAVIPPDEVTRSYLGTLMEVGWHSCDLSDSDMLHIDVGLIDPLITWGTRPDQMLSLAQENAVLPAGGPIETYEYMGLEAGESITGTPIDLVFIGSCANGRLTDLRAAAAVLKGRKISGRLKRAVVSPGSSAVRRAAEAEGIDQVFLSAGFEWREPGCSFCVAMNGDLANPGDRVVSTSNRNFVGRQGAGVRTHLASPAVAAACALAGEIISVRKSEALS